MTKTVKRNFFLISVLTVGVLTGCIREIEKEVTPKEARTIVFESVRITAPTESNSPITRGYAIPGFYIPQNESFLVSAYTYPNGNAPDAPTVWGSFDEKEVSVVSAENKFEYAPIEGWPTNAADRLRFWAYYPLPEKFNGTGGSLSAEFFKQSTTEAMKLTYKLSTNPAEHKDVMYASTDLLSHQKVFLDFKHALTRVNFLARMGDGFRTIYPSASTINLRITGMRITNALLEGNLTVSAGGAASWEATANGLGTITMNSGNVLTGTSLDYNGQYATQLKVVSGSQSHDLLMIPMDKNSFNNMVLKVDVEITENNTPRTVTYDYPFEGTQLWQKNGWINYLLTIQPDRIVVEPIVLDWKDQKQHIVFDKQYYLQISNETVKTDKKGGSILLALHTNYDGTDGRYQPGVWVDYPSNLPGWLGVTTESGNGTDTEDGMLLRNIKLNIAANLTSGSRNSSFHIRAGNLNYKFNIEQTDQSWLEYNVAAQYPPDGNAHSFSVRGTGFDWIISNVIDRDNILTGPSMVGISGYANALETVGFSVVNDNSKQGKKVELIFSDPKGICADETVTLYIGV